MKTKIVWLFAIILMQVCTAQKNISTEKEHRVIDTKKETDVVIANITGGRMLPLYLIFNNSLEEGNFFIDLSPQSTDLMDLSFSNSKSFSFYEGEKDMEIECKCIENQNYYLKNLKIEEGNYKLVYKKGIKIKGSEIKVSDSIQNTLFKNIRANIHTKSKNIYFKDLEFVVLDLADTLNVKLKKVN